MKTLRLDALRSHIFLRTANFAWCGCRDFVGFFAGTVAAQAANRVCGAQGGAGDTAAPNQAPV
jgi:hypothetical protein